MLLDKLSGWFIASVIVLLVITGMAKLLAPFGSAQILGMQEPITGIPFGALLPAVGILELLIVSVGLLSDISMRAKLGLIAWLSTTFLIHRIGLWGMGWHHPCGCIGNLAGMFYLPDATADAVTKCVLGYMVAGSCALMGITVGARSNTKMLASSPL